MKALLQCKRKAFPGQTEAERWKQIYQTLFPMDEEVPEPCKLVKKAPSLYHFSTSYVFNSTISFLLITISRFRAYPGQ
jgi:hypothetical protein